MLTTDEPYVIKELHNRFPLPIDEVVKLVKPEEMDSRDNSSLTSLSPEQKAAIKMLASGCSIRYTALVLRVNQAIISAWIARDPAFKSMLKEAASCNPAYDGIGEAKPATSVESEVTVQLRDLVEE